MTDVLLVAPVVPGVTTGNAVTAARWAGFLRDAGARVRVAAALDDAPWDVLVALHARRSAEAIRTARARHPDAPIVVGLSGTELRPEEVGSREVIASFDAATRIVALQERALDLLGPAHRAKARVILQSASAPSRLAGPEPGSFDVCVLAHLREVKDPLRAALAARELPASSAVRVVHVGAALSEDWVHAAREEERTNPRYRWLGGTSHDEALAVLARSRLHVLSSRSEGGANAISEALALGVPTLTSRIPASLGQLGEDWPATFAVGDTHALATLLSRAETDAEFLADLVARTNELAAHVHPDREREAWRSLLAELLGAS